MKISVKRETATYAPTLKLSCMSSSLLFLYHVMYTVYFVSHHVIAYPHVYYSLMFNNVILHYAHVYYSPMFIVLSVDVVVLLIMVTLKVLSHIPYLALFHFSLSNYEQLCIHVDGWLSC